MSFNTESFIIDLVKYLNLQNMDTPRRRRLEELQGQNVLTKKQATWDLENAKQPSLTTKDPNDTSSYLYNDETYEPTHKDLKDLYLKLVVIMRDMAADKELVNDTKAVKTFLDDFYGDGKAIEKFNATKISDSDRTGIATYITNNNTLSNALKIKQSDLDYLANSLEADTYSTDTKSFRILNDFFAKLYDWDTQGGARLLPQTDLPACLGMSGVPNYENLLGLIKIINTPVPPNEDQLKQLNDNDNLAKMLTKVVTNDKVLDALKSKDSEGVISKWINKGINETNYKTGDNALAPQYADRKTFWKNAESKVKKFYVDTLGKLKEKHTRHIYATTGARFIVKGLIDKGVTPASGTKKLLETLDAISGDMPNPVQSQLKWMKETLSSMSTTTVFKDALHDGAQLKKLVDNIIDVAVHQNKTDEAMVALEVLAVMRYTMMTSSVRDKVKEASKINLFSDADLSWNKNEGIRFVTSAIDGTIGFAVRGTFEIANLIKNAINQQGLRFDRNKKAPTTAGTPPTNEKEQTRNLLRGFWNTINSSANTKDYNPFRSHEKLQKASDKANEDYENDPDTKQKSFAKTLKDLTDKYDYSL